MKDIQVQKKSHFTAENVATAVSAAAAFLASIVSMTVDDPTSAPGGAYKFVKNIHAILNLISVVVVIITITFASYQTVFTHKCISDVTPVLISGVLTGVVGQIAKMSVGNIDSCSIGTTSAMF